jgi:hypothetical protein
LALDLKQADQGYVMKAIRQSDGTLGQACRALIQNDLCHRF